MKRFRLRDTFWIVTQCSLILAIWWAAILSFPIGTMIYTLRNADAYRHCKFTVDSLHYDSGSKDEMGGATYWAMGRVDPGSHFERMSLHDFFEKPPECQTDMEKVLHRGDVLPVLFNTEMTDTMLQTTTPRVLLNRGDIWKAKRSNLNHLLAVALVPLFVTSVMVWLARRGAKSGPLITLRSPEWKAKPITPG